MPFPETAGPGASENGHESGFQRRRFLRNFAFSHFGHLLLAICVPLSKGTRALTTLDMLEFLQILGL